MHPRMTASDAASILGVTVQAIHRQIKSKNLQHAKYQKRVCFGHSTSREIFKFDFPKTEVVSFQVVKGGTGKTTIAHSFAVRAALYGAKVLCVDVDQQGNLTQALNVNPEELPVIVDLIESGDFSDAVVNVVEGLDLIPSRMENARLDHKLLLDSMPLDKSFDRPIKNLIKQNHYDLVVIDCPPAIGPATMAAALSSSMVISPITPEKFALSGLKVTMEALNALEDRYGLKINAKVLLNKYDSRTTLSRDMLTALASHPIFGKHLLNVCIRANQDFPNVIAASKSIFDTTSPSVAKEDIDFLTQEILGLVEHNEEGQGIPLGSLEEETALA